MAERYSAAEFAALWTHNARARAEGPVRWKYINRGLRCYIPVEADGFATGEVLLCVRIHLKRPNEVTVLLLIRDEPAVHLDVNQQHREQGELYDGTHLQWDSGRGRGFRMEPEAPSLPLDGDVTASDYRAILRYFIELLGIDAAGLEWQAPEIGGMA